MFHPAVQRAPRYLALFCGFDDGATSQQALNGCVHLPGFAGLSHLLAPRGAHISAFSSIHSVTCDGQ
jgi:hypothetical protein